MACEYAGGSIKQIVPLYSTECQQVEHMQPHFKRQCYACNLVYVINAIMFTILAKGMVVIHVCTEDEAVQ